MSCTELIGQENGVWLMIDHNMGFGVGVGSCDRQELDNGAVALARVCRRLGFRSS